MEQNIPIHVPSQLYRALYEIRRSAPTWDAFYLWGLAETLNLIEIENTGEPGKHDLQTDAIVRIERAWGDCESDAWVGGFILQLRYGRRVYVESYADGIEWGPDSCASVVQMDAGNDLPKLPRDHGSESCGWVDDLPELNGYLRRLHLGMA